MSPTARTLKKLRDEGWTAQVVERWCQFSRRRIDLFGFIDVVAIRDGETLGVQATTAGHRLNRIGKIRTIEAHETWLAAGNGLEVWGWSKRKVKRGGKAVRWDVTITRLESITAKG